MWLSRFSAKYTSELYIKSAAPLGLYSNESTNLPFKVMLKLVAVVESLMMWSSRIK